MIYSNYLIIFFKKVKIYFFNFLLNFALTVVAVSLLNLLFMNLAHCKHDQNLV